MGRDGDLKRRFGLWLHRWLVKLRLLKGPRHDRPGIDSPPSLDLEAITMREVGYTTADRPGAVTIEDPARIAEDGSGRATIEYPERVLIDGDPGLVIDRPASVTIQDRDLVVVEDVDDRSRMIPLDAAEGPGPFVFLRPDTVRITNAQQVTFGTPPDGDSVRIDG